MLVVLQWRSGGGIMTIGFGNTDEDAGTPGVLEGDSHMTESVERDAKLFLQLCKDLRELGATDVKLGSMRARFGASAPAAQPTAIIRVPVGVQERNPEPEEKLELYPGEVLTSEDKARRREQQRIRDLVTG
jgi:hypothetical protein